MKTLAKILAWITLVAVVLFAYHIFASRLNTQYSVQVVPAVMMDDMFTELKSEVSNGQYEGAPEVGSIDDYAFVTVTVTARSFTPFAAEWVTFSLNSEDGDVLVVTQDAGPNDIAAFESGTYTITILTTDKDGVRDAILNYYILGQNRSLYLSSAGEADK